MSHATNHRFLVSAGDVTPLDDDPNTVYTTVTLLRDDTDPTQTFLIPVELVPKLVNAFTEAGLLS